MGRYRIQAVSEMTGVPAATLRAWERRYGVPTPARTDASYRLYSDHDVDLVRRLRDLCAGGIAPAEAAKIVLRREVAQQTLPVGGPFDAHRERIIRAAEALDVETLEAEVRSALMLGSTAMIFEGLIEPTLREIGERWHRGRLTVAQEHLASEVLSGLARDLLRLAQPADAARTVLLGCFADETHAIALYVIGFRFAQWGFRSLLLGARTPPSAVAQAVERAKPALVALSITVELPAERAAELVARYAEACGGTPWVVGGQASPGHAELIEAHGGLVAGEDISELPSRLGPLLSPSARRGAH